MSDMPPARRARSARGDESSAAVDRRDLAALCRALADKAGDEQ